MAPVQVPAQARLALQPGQGQGQRQPLRPLGQSVEHALLDRARCHRPWPGPGWQPKPA